MAYPELDLRPWNLGLPLLVLATACGPKVAVGDESSSDTIDPTDPTVDPSDPTNPTDPTGPYPGQCTYDWECGYNYACIDGQCVYQGYCDDGGCCYDYCCYDECCYDGCWYECYSDSDCAPGEVCNGGYCTPGEIAECPTLPEFIPIPLPQGADGAAMTLAFVQTDADLARELVIGTPNGAQLVDAGSSPEALPVAGLVLEAVAGDLDGDGDDDLVLSVTDDQGEYTLQTLVQEPAGEFMPTQLTSGVYLGLSAGDMTGDGIVDVAAAASGFENFDLWVFEGGGGQLGASTLLASAELDVPLTAMSLVDGDIYADVAAHAVGGVRWWRGGPTIDAAWEGELGDVQWPVGLHGGDLDADGVGDLATVVDASQWAVVTLWPGQGGGPSWSSGASIPMWPYASTAGDIDGDAASEVVIGGNAVLGIVRSNFGQIDCYSIVQAPHDVARLAVGDYDGDAVGDVVVSDGVTTTVMVRLSP